VFGKHPANYLVFYLSQFDDPVFTIPLKIMICYLLRPGFDQPDNIRKLWPPQIFFSMR
jgi:hypothetical protein